MFTVAGRARLRNDWLASATRRLRADERVAAAWLFGSMASGNADELSDVDLFVSFVDGCEDVLERIDRWLAELGELGRWREDTYNAPDRGRYFEATYSGAPLPLVVDCYWQPAAAALLGSDTRLLFDKVGLRRGPPGVTTYELIPTVGDSRPFVVPDDLAVRVRERASAFWSDVAIVAKHRARGWGHAEDEAAALGSTVEEMAADLGVTAYRRGPGHELSELVEEMDRVLRAADVGGIDSAGRADAHAWIAVCEALRQDGWTPGANRDRCDP